MCSITFFIFIIHFDKKCSLNKKNLKKYYKVPKRNYLSNSKDKNIKDAQMHLLWVLQKCSSINL